MSLLSWVLTVPLIRLVNHNTQMGVVYNDHTLPVLLPVQLLLWLLFSFMPLLRRFLGIAISTLTTPPRFTCPTLPYGCHFPSRAPRARHDWQMSVLVYLEDRCASRTFEPTTYTVPWVFPSVDKASGRCRSLARVRNAPRFPSPSCPDIPASVRAHRRSPTNRRSATTALQDE